MSPLLEFFSDFGAWNWLILAAALFVLELLAPGIFLMWFGTAALIVGIVAFLLPMSWQYELILFGILSLIALLAARNWIRREPLVSDRPFLNRRAEQCVGRSYVLAEPIVDGRGKAQVGDTLWSVSGPDAPRGALVKVIAAEGNLLKVQPADG